MALDSGSVTYVSLALGAGAARFLANSRNTSPNAGTLWRRRLKSPC